MDLKFILISYTFIAGFFGMANRLYIALFLKASGSIQSPNIFKRYLFKYFTLSNAYLLSFFITPALINPIVRSTKSAPGGGPAYLLFVFCLPLALLIYWLDCKHMIVAEARWKRAHQPWWARSK